MPQEIRLPPEQDMVDRPMTLGEHLEELRRRLIYALLGLAGGMVLGLVFGASLVRVLEGPYQRIAAEMHLDPAPAALTVTDAFFTYFRVAFIAGILVAAPWIFYQLWQFVAVGLRPRERRYVHCSIPISALLFLAGALFFLTVVSGPMLRFFLGFNQWLEVRPVIRLSELIAFMTNLMLVFGIAFQTPVAVFILARTGVVPLPTLRRYRRHVILILLVVAALLTSPSPVDQVAMAVPMWLLYEAGIALAAMLERRDARSRRA